MLELHIVVGEEITGKALLQRVQNVFGPQYGYDPILLHVERRERTKVLREEPEVVRMLRVPVIRLQHSTHKRDV